MKTFRIYFKDGRVVRVKAERLQFMSSGVVHFHNKERAPIYINHPEIIAVISEESLAGEETPKPS
jgi:hypothetical protein